MQSAGDNGGEGSMAEKKSMERRERRERMEGIERLEKLEKAGKAGRVSKVALAVTAITLIAMAYTHTCTLFSDAHLEAEEFFLAFNESGNFLVLSSAGVYRRPLPTNQAYDATCMQRG
eukprot:761765-Hanusia_phi.AAC.1